MEEVHYGDEGPLWVVVPLKKNEININSFYIYFIFSNFPHKFRIINFSNNVISAEQSALSLLKPVDWITRF